MTTSREIAPSRRERPIVFSSARVRAILDGRMVQARLVVDRLTTFGKITEFQPSATPGYAWTFRDRRMLWQDIRANRLVSACPYGQPGDRLWVREPFATYDGGPRDDGERSTGVLYRADPMYDGCGPGDFAWSWRPSIHMPREASRITLELTDVRVQRVRQISDDDCTEEGCGGGHDAIPDYGFSATPYEHFRHLWDSLNAKRGFGWNANPWVWALTFRRIDNAA